MSVAFLLAENFTLSAFANFVDVLRLAADEADMSRPILCDWAVLSDTLAPVRASCGVRVQPDTRLRDAKRFDYLVIVGGVMGDDAALRPALRQFLTTQANAGVPLIGLCTGVFLMQEAGLLRGYRCCVNWFHHQDFVDRFENERPVSDQIFVVDRDRLTCSGGHGAAHLAAFLVSRHIGEPAAIKSLNIMMIEDPLDGDRAQPGHRLDLRPRDTLVKKAVLRMQQHVELPLTVAELAVALDTPRRTLERRFLRDLGQSPAKVYLRLRLDRALARLRGTDTAIPDIALACGFCDASHLTRALRSEHGLTPAEYRRAQANGDAKPLGVELPAEA